MPAHLMQYRDIFVYHDEAKAESLGEDFDARMLSLIADPCKQSWSSRSGEAHRAY